jgi:hypothetical protein
MNKALAAFCIFIFLTGCKSGELNERMNQPVFTVNDLEHVASVTVRWRKAQPNGQIIKESNGDTIWLSSDLSEANTKEFIGFLKQAKFEPYAPGSTTLYKSAPYHIVLTLDDGQTYELRYADAFMRMIIMGSGEFRLNPEHRFDFDVPREE